jgi:hypothetical protein
MSLVRDCRPPPQAREQLENIDDQVETSQSTGVHCVGLMQLLLSVLGGQVTPPTTSALRKIIPFPQLDEHALH